ncbi:unnamed protein product, partial [Rotaria sp. Silwood1]
MRNTIESYISKRKDEYKNIERNLSHTMLTTDYRGNNIDIYNQQSFDYTTFTQSQSVAIIHIKRFIENLIEIGYELGLYG